MNFSIEKDGCLPFQMLTFFVKEGNLQLMFMEKRSSVEFIPTLYLKYKTDLILVMIILMFQFVL